MKMKMAVDTTTYARTKTVGMEAYQTPHYFLCQKGKSKRVGRNCRMKSRLAEEQEKFLAELSKNGRKVQKGFHQ